MPFSIKCVHLQEQFTFWEKDFVFFWILKRVLLKSLSWPKTEIRKNIRSEECFSIWFFMLSKLLTKPCLGLFDLTKRMVNVFYNISCFEATKDLRNHVNFFLGYEKILKSDRYWFECRIIFVVRSTSYKFNYWCWAARKAQVELRRAQIRSCSDTP